MGKASLTEHLLGSSGGEDTGDLYRRATQSEFLARAGQGRLPREQLSQWLSQDRLYAQAYVRFIGGLISRVHLPPEADGADGGGATVTLRWRVLALLQSCLGGIMTELRFFEKTAADYGLNLAAAAGGGTTAGFGPNETTRAYVELFDSFAAGARDGQPPRTLLDGLLVLWTTEKAYLDAWTFARQQGQAAPEGQGAGAEDLDGGALRRAFIPNWTSDEFRGFVGEISECLDQYATSVEEEEENNEDGETKQAKLAECMALFEDVLKLEEDFWPVVA
ncbi:heme oxygenase-like protein [Xylariaceae sp. FL0804]|nr:heme oxygenase-like protein [Xylariaceae sp. FL0804]